MGVEQGNDAAPVLILKLQDGTIPFDEFARAVAQLAICEPAAREIIERGLHDKDRSTAVACATALCFTASEPDRIARADIDAVRAEHFTNRDAIKALTRLKGGDDLVIPFLVEQLKNTDYWTRYDAIRAIGELGPRAASAVTPLRKHLDDKAALIRLKAAAAFLSIADDPAELEKQLDAVYVKVDRAERRDAMATIAELKRADGWLARYPLNELRRSPPELTKNAIEALQAIGTEEAAVVLRVMASSSDWAIRSQANEALGQMKKGEGKEGD
jgi:HEAT repeat protein